jgi:hypothetical protein
MSLALRNLLFTAVVPGSGAVLNPWWVLTHGGATPAPRAWSAVAAIAAGVVLYLSCVRVFAVVGRGMPSPWDPPQRLVAIGPCRWVHNPIYLAAILHLLVIGYEEPRLRPVRRAVRGLPTHGLALDPTPAARELGAGAVTTRRRRCRQSCPGSRSTVCRTRSSRMSPTPRGSPSGRTTSCACALEGGRPPGVGTRFTTIRRIGRVE